jgi:hypothetical protein
MIMEVRKNECKRGKTNVKLPPRKTDIARDSVIIRLIYAQTDVNEIRGEKRRRHKAAGKLQRVRLTRDARVSSLRRAAAAESLKNDVKFTKRRSRDADKTWRRTCNRSRAPQRELDCRYKVLRRRNKNGWRENGKRKKPGAVLGARVPSFWTSDT